MLLRNLFKIISDYQSLMLLLLKKLARRLGWPGAPNRLDVVAIRLLTPTCGVHGEMGYAEPASEVRKTLAVPVPCEC